MSFVTALVFSRFKHIFRMKQLTAFITCSDIYMGPALVKKFIDLGFHVVRHKSTELSEHDINQLVSSAGDIHLLIANFAELPMPSSVSDIDTEDWRQLFNSLVHPLMYFVRAVTPQMLERKSGKIIAITSAAPLRGIPNNSAYCSARGAQNSFVKAVGLELARENIQVNAIAQNYIKNSTYYPDDFINTEKFRNHVKRNVPTQAVGSAEETAELAAYLAHEDCRHIVGQIIPLSGGWIT